MIPLLTIDIFPDLIQAQHNDISHATPPRKSNGPGLATVHRTESTKSATDTGELITP